MQGPERIAFENFKARLSRVETEVRSIDQELSHPDLLGVAHRCREAIRMARDLLERNVDILFAGQPPHVHDELWAQLEYAGSHVNRALSDEVVPQRIEQRLLLATRLTQDALDRVKAALEAVGQSMDDGNSGGEE